MVRRTANLVINLNNVMYGGDRASTLESYMDCYVLDVKTLKVHKYSYDEIHAGLKNETLELENMFLMKIMMKFIHQKIGMILLI